MIELSRPLPGVVQVTLRRPERRNALSLAGFRELAAAWGEVAGSGARACVLTGGADFSSGADLAGFAEDLVAAAGQGPGGGREVWATVNAAVLRDTDLEIPVIAAVEGVCMGAGMELVGATDVRIAGESAVFALPEVRHGFLASGGSVARLPRQIGYAAAMQVLLTGARFGAADMLARGFVSEVVPDGTALARALEVAAQIAANDPRAVAAVKRVVAQTLRGTLADALAAETREFRALVERP
ncbi:enoyl-CoA hydratase/isomerase family protein [Trujillonella endophytica]|uniref:Enoyl-CoA hydratase n=1 Tax=Trujillonella endophytica TaxID=673521 RepID=A0A1H8VW46_9ACTN|nr:enoyl-CoA hydratase/isomerase family protein [Trujillella endophytica]SEP19457.1 enoyl-CoA hydratase [Trujillella endophytica]